MDDYRAVFSEALYNAITETARITWERHKDLDKDAIPDRATMQRLFETAFFLSLREEEGRPLSVRLTYMDKDRLVNRERRGGIVAALKFEQEFPCTVSELVKLAPSIDSRTATFAVVNDQNDLKIAGIFQFGPNAAPLARSHRYPPPMGFGLLTRGPGRVMVTLGSFLLGRFEDGHFSAPEYGELWTEGSLGRIFIGAARAHTWHGLDAKAYALTYLLSIEELLHDMAARGHGGCVLWVPRSGLAQAEKFLNIRRKISVASHLGVDHIARSLDADGSERQMQNRLRQYVGMLANFTNVDGALVLDDYLKPIGYSAEIINTQRWDGPVQNMSRTDRSQIKLANFGMRHNSAAAFVAAVPGSIALVLSQDGPARAIRCHDGVLQWWLDCTAAVFV